MKQHCKGGAKRCPLQTPGRVDAPTIRQRILRRDAHRSMLVSLAFARVGLALHCWTVWVLDRLETLSRRQRRHASDLAVLGGLAPMPERRD